jgi:hypothetical protein
MEEAKIGDPQLRRENMVDVNKHAPTKGSEKSQWQSRHEAMKPAAHIIFPPVKEGVGGSFPPRL